MTDNDINLLQSDRSNRSKTTKIILSQENEALRRHSAAWNAVGAIASRLALGQPLDTVLNEAMRECAQALSADALCVMLLDENRERMPIRASIGFDTGLDKHIPVQEGQAVEQAARESMPLWSLPETLLKEESAERSLANAVFLPLVLRDTPLGVLFAARSRSAPAFSEEENRILLSVANQIALVAYNEGPAKVLMAYERMERDLHFAHMLKKRVLPESVPELSGARADVQHLPCLHAGGDFHDALRLPDGGAALLLGKTSGHGVNGALNVAELIPLFRGALASGLELSEAVRQINEALVQPSRRGQMINLCLMRLHPGGRRVDLVRVGSTLVYVLRGTTVETITSGPHTPLGMLKECAVEMTTLELDAGEALLAGTDGLLRCVPPGVDASGREWLSTVIADLPPAGEGVSLARQVSLAARCTCGSHPLEDDITLLSIEAGS